MRNLIARDVRGSPQSRFLVFFLKMSTVDCETSKEYSSNSEQSLAYEASEDWFHSANEEFFLPYDVGTDVRFQLKSLQTDFKKCFFSRHII